MNTTSIGNLAVASKTSLTSTNATRTLQQATNDFASYVNQSKKSNQVSNTDSTDSKEDTSTTCTTFARKDIQNASDTTAVSNADTQKVDSALEDWKDKVEELLKDKLGVSEDQINAAMSTLGFTVQDLLDPQNLSALIAKLTQTTDNMSLVMSDSYQEIMQSVSELTESMISELGIDMKQLKSICNFMNQQAMTENTQETNLAADATMDSSSNNTLVSTGANSDKLGIANVNSTQNQSAEQGKEVVVSDALNTKESTSETLAGKTQDLGKSNQNTVSTMIQNQNQQDSNQSNMNQPNSDQSNSNQSNSNLASSTQPTIQMSESTDEKQADSNFTVKSNDNNSEQKPDTLQMVNFMKQSNVIYQNDATQMTQFQQSYVDTQSLLDQISEYTKVFNFQDSTTMQMQLNPENLGKIYVQVTQKAGEITATIAATDERVKEALQTQVANLKDSLNQQGIKVNAVEVTIASHEFEQNLEQNANAKQQSQDQSGGNLQQDNTNQNNSSSTRTLNLNYLTDENLDDIPEELVVKIMKDNGNQVDITV